MNRALILGLALVLVALGWQSWRLNNASHTIETQGAVLKKQNAGTNEEKQSVDWPVHSDRNQQPGADAALCSDGTDHRTAAEAASAGSRNLNVKTRICAAGLTLLCLLTLSGCANVRPLPEVELTVNGCPRVTQCRWKGQHRAVTVI